MNSNKVALMVIAVVAIGIFALPSTVSLFSGQHTWYNLNDTGSQVPCEKCHADIDDEMISTDNGVHRNLSRVRLPPGEYHVDETRDWRCRW